VGWPDPVIPDLTTTVEQILGSGDKVAVFRTVRGTIKAAERYLAVRACHHLGQVQRARGPPGRGGWTYRRALEITAAPGHPALPGPGIAYVAWPGR
jgi:hypothetical protein